MQISTLNKFNYKLKQECYI